VILERLEVQISEAKDLEFSRKDVLEKMDRWQAALEEESWLEEYSRVGPFPLCNVVVSNSGGITDVLLLAFRSCRTRTDTTSAKGRIWCSSAPRKRAPWSAKCRVT
jgi:hypothetical protein